MKIVDSSDWRENLPFETPTLVADVVPGEPTRCVGCGADSALHERSELWAVKHRHPKNHSGFVRFYCAEHRPAVVVAPAPVVAAAKPKAARKPAAPRTTTPRPTPSIDRVRAMCPDCFLEVSATGECGMCGNKVF
ncbi:glucose-6-phosphate dehydrogenase [Microbacterium hominis]|uniref:Glucose-6-phosphate dehydrogenase n=1 Tax=Microbacterium hominis TaxID=162426 RepID=A0A7D4UA87_9MICO|nr:glucose-6-phosphate dehydrogenase [Microbacterium hominis]QKJ18183.1 glucose-6-phosphate dehydrogenase [Microbacterium hominis]